MHAAQFAADVDSLTVKIEFIYGSGVESRKTANDASQCSPA